MSQTQMLKIDSRYRYNVSTTDPSNCTVPLRNALSGVYRLCSIMLPVTYWNVHADNSIVYWTDTSGSHSTNLAHGYYSSFSDVATALATAMNAVGSGTVTCSVSSLTNILTVTNTEAFSFTFGINSAKSAATLLGFAGDSVSSDLTQVGSKTMNLSEMLFYNIVISDTHSAVSTVDGKSCTFCIPAVTVTPDLTYYEPSAENPIYIRFSPTSELSIKICDDLFRPLNNMKSDWTMMLTKVSG